jgi:hypothetical protein
VTEKPPIFVTFATPDYAAESKRLIASFKRFGLEYFSESFMDTGRWVTNCGHKPIFLKEMMVKYPDRAVVWVDADAEVKKEPRELLTMPSWADVGACRYTWKKGRKTELLSGTIYLKNNEIAHDVVDEWVKTQRRAPQLWDQVTLDEVLRRLRHVLFYALPVEYCFITDFHRDENPGIEPVIEHYQKSREMRLKKP